MNCVIDGNEPGSSPGKHQGELLTFFCCETARRKAATSFRVGAAGLTARRLIFRLHSIKAGSSGQLMSTMTFSNMSAIVTFNHRWLRDGVQSPASRAMVRLCMMSGCYKYSFNWFFCSLLQSCGDNRDTLHVLSRQTSESPRACAFQSSAVLHHLFFPFLTLPFSSYVKHLHQDALWVNQKSHFDLSVLLTFIPLPNCYLWQPSKRARLFLFPNYCKIPEKSHILGSLGLIV